MSRLWQTLTRPSDRATTVPVSCHRNSQHLSHRKTGCCEEIAVFVSIKNDLPIWQQRRRSLKLVPRICDQIDPFQPSTNFLIAAGRTLCSLELSFSSVTDDVAVKQKPFERIARRDFAIVQRLTVQPNNTRQDCCSVVPTQQTQLRRNRRA